MSDAKSPLSHPADRLLTAIDLRRSPVCVGIDPVVEKLPASRARAARESASESISGIRDYCRGLLEAVASHVPCVKIQSACFERFGDQGVALIGELIRLAHAQNLQVILDAKRGDMGISAEHYAAAAFGDLDDDSLARADPREIKADPGSADWLTINSYLGEDGITPFLRHQGHGAFALVRTSNPGGDAIQNLALNDGRTVAHAVGEIVATVGAKHLGQRGYSSLGAVIGATKKKDATKLREIMPQQMFLVPGYGAQGGGVQDVLPCFKSDGTGAIVTASRSVIYAFDQRDPKWMDSVANAAAKFAEEVGRAVGMR